MQVIHPDYGRGQVGLRDLNREYGPEVFAIMQDLQARLGAFDIRLPDPYGCPRPSCCRQDYRSRSGGLSSRGGSFGRGGSSGRL